MKEQNYKRNIKGWPMDKLQEGDFNYEVPQNDKTLGEYAKELRVDLAQKELTYLYSSNSSFKAYVDKYCIKHKLDIEEALKVALVKEYAKNLKENNDKIKNGSNENLYKKRSFR